MTEQDWLSYHDDSREMIDFLCSRYRVNRTKAGKRKLRLYVAACARQVEGKLDNDDVAVRGMINVLEGYADGQATDEELVQGRLIPFHIRTSRSHSDALRVVRAGCYANEIRRVTHDVSLTAAGRIGRPSIFERPLDPIALQRQADYLRDVFGNPFRPIALNHAWLAWNDGTVRKMAQAIYDDRAFDRLPILADALEDAGFADADILGHLRGPGSHVRGCWAVDLLLGKA